MKKHFIFVIVLVVLFCVSIATYFIYSSGYFSKNSKPSREAESGCRWEQKTGAGLRIMTQTCDYGFRRVQIIPNETLPVFTEQFQDQDKNGKYGKWENVGNVIEVFSLKVGQNIESLLPKLTTKQNDFPEGATCDFEKSDTYNIPGKSRYVLTPTGATKKAYELSSADEVPTPPCGKYGIDADAESYFEVQDKHPNVALFVNIGQDTPMFDETQIEITGAK